MIIGILDADILPRDLQKQYISYASLIKNLLRRVDSGCQFKVYSVIKNEYPDSLGECDAYVISGSKSSAYDKDRWIQTLISFVQTLYRREKRLIGICFGHQVIAQALMGKTALADVGWGVGVHRYDTTDIARTEFDYLPTEISLLVSHRDQVISLPEKATLLAHSKFCPNAAYTIKDQVLCFQGHPEFTPGYANALMQKRKDIIPKKTFDQAQDGLSAPTHNTLVAKCLLDFASR